MLGVVLLGQLDADVLQFQRGQGQALALDPGEDLPDQVALHAVGLDQDKGLLSHEQRAYRSVTALRHFGTPSDPALRRSYRTAIRWTVADRAAGHGPACV
ncbi:uncharacterized protein RMCFA_2548 [Mycolicibacterium fortuitum subsp. acetamidolyticum]|uniref:Uncharacterized protein n=1 Tax=Mycolicibacterium fortuitum subsp. acetamidolyticum TaxID=144550 RepID=A0A117IEB2_MYCFO|nr:uncharacterized protein RMCFA_2548 [Mycolicibacterium fortuitum subsp. acetamidolyticum]